MDKVPEEAVTNHVFLLRRLKFYGLQTVRLTKMLVDQIAECISFRLSQPDGKKCYLKISHLRNSSGLPRDLT